jgi:WD40 repeat protein
MANGDLLSCSFDNTIWRWSKSGKEASPVFPEHKSRVTYLAAHPSGELFVSSSFDKHIFVHRENSQSREEILNAHRDFVRSVSFSPDGSLLASNGGERDGHVHFWRTDKWEKVFSLREPASRHWSCNIAWSPTELTLATLGEEDRVVRIWRVNPGENYANFPPLEDLRRSPAKKPAAKKAPPKK